MLIKQTALIILIICTLASCAFQGPSFRIGELESVERDRQLVQMAVLETIQTLQKQQKK